MAAEDITPTPEDLDFEGVTSRFADIDTVSIDASRIPEQFRHLVDFARFWSVMDDSERADLMWLTPPEELQAFVNAAWPLMSEINTWCDEHSETVPVPDEVVLFQLMMQAAAEAVALHVEPET